MGKDQHGGEITQQRQYYTYTPMLDVITKTSKTPYPKDILQKSVAYQLHLQQQLPAGQYMVGAKESAKQIANEGKYAAYAEQQLALMKRSRFVV